MRRIQFVVLLCAVAFAVAGCAMFEPYADPMTGIVQEPIAVKVLAALGATLNAVAPAVGTVVTAGGVVAGAIFGGRKATKMARGALAARKARKLGGS